MTAEDTAPTSNASATARKDEHENNNKFDWLMEQTSGPQHLFDEVHDALRSAFLMFCLPDLKALAKEGLLQGDPAMVDRIVHMPTSLYDVVTIYGKNKELLTQERLGDAERADMYHDALSLAKVTEHDDETKQYVMKQVVLHALDDVNEQKECVYAIGENPFLKRISVAFRGSVTDKDFQQDAKALFSVMENPAKKAKKQLDQNLVEQAGLPDKFGLHWGFKEYLYGTTAELKRDDFVPKYKIILDQVAALLENKPGYHLRIVGHSLGGALTTVLAMEAAGDDRIPSPITAITSGAPKVGNLSFLTSFQYLEEVGRIRCIQVANNKDPVTQSPPIGNFDPIGPCLYRQRIFRHVGLRLLLVPEGFVIWYPSKAKSCPGILAFDLMYVCGNCCIFLLGCILVSFCCNAFALLALPLCCCCSYKVLKKSRQHHTQLKYIRRLEHCKDALTELALDELNRDRFRRSVFSTRVLAEHTSQTPFIENVADIAPVKLSKEQLQQQEGEEEGNNNKDIEQGDGNANKPDNKDE